MGVYNVYESQSSMSTISYICIMFCHNPNKGELECYAPYKPPSSSPQLKLRRIRTKGGFLKVIAKV